MHATTSADSTTRYYGAELEDGTVVFTSGSVHLSNYDYMPVDEGYYFFEPGEVTVQFDQCAYDESDDYDDVYDGGFNHLTNH